MKDRPVLLNNDDYQLKAHLEFSMLFIRRTETERQGLEYAVAVNEDLYSVGVDLLIPFEAIVTGTHPEYHAHQMLSSIQDYTASGGRLAHLGGNGFYWLTSYNRNGAAIGDAGQVLDGAAGDELGCVDEKLGTPAETAVLAVTEGIDDMYQPVKEDYTAFVAAQGGATSPKGRSDIAVFEIADGGGVFSLDLHAGSLACHPTGSRITRRVKAVTGLEDGSPVGTVSIMESIVDMIKVDNLSITPSDEHRLVLYAYPYMKSSSALRIDRSGSAKIKGANDRQPFATSVLLREEGSTSSSKLSSTMAPKRPILLLSIMNVVKARQVGLIESRRPRMWDNLIQ
ncbi:Uncharacterized protein HZ326_23742 [Fusarium oxysporum f. sp. albedinis]|nr:Uncharacterized protein HZ326_23742 [Fusarium oxysporum f. sp. albedinis]